MKLTVGDVMKLEPLADAKVIAGHKGLANAVTSVSVLEVPKATTFIKEGQIEISAFYSIAESVDAQLDVIRMLKKCKASGLILSHVGIILDSVSKKLIDLCNELVFPLILASPNIAYIDIISPILNSLLQMQNQKLEHAMRIYDKMTSLMLEEKDFDDIIAALGKLINRRVCFFNYNNICVSSSPNDLSPEYGIYIKQSIQDCLNSFFNEKKDICITSLDRSGAILLAPVISSMMYYGVLVIFDASDLNELDSISIAQTKNALGIITLNKINLKDYNILLKHDYINDLIVWNFSDEGTALQRGLALGCDVSKIKVSVILDIFNFSEISLQHPENKIQKIKTEFYNTVQNELSYFAPESIMVNFSDKILILFDCEKDEAHTKQRVWKIGEQLRQTVAQTLGFPISVGIGGYYDNVSQIKTSYQEALSALRISNRIFGMPRCTSFEEVQVYSFIRDSIDASKAKTIVNGLLLPIIQYDEKYDAQLLATFKMLILCDMDTMAVSEKLFIHKNTVLQRKNKISKLFKNDPFSVPYRLQFQIAIVLENILNYDAQ
ncbi:MAG TPA: PucR family transcriptional regulator ligand-binding domain-containing protein [Clostridia bacterium]|nr:PucR family transcriptional regulator ligand-binding domain-containing protein [Clostridia bacterium]